MTSTEQTPRRAGRPLRADRPPPLAPPVPAERGERPGGSVGLVVLGALIVLLGISGGWPMLVMVAAIVVMIFMHELGHFLTAKWAGMKVTEFFIGFGPRVWSFRRGETEYGVKALPAGAYVRIIGMNNLDEFDPADSDRTYMSKPFWRRLSVAVAGSTMHFLMAIVSFFVLLTIVGVPGGQIVMTPADEERVLATAPWTVARVSDDSAASRAGVEAGDRIVSIDGVPIDSFTQFAEAVQALPARTVDVAYERAGEVRTRTVRLGSRQVDEEWEGFFGVGPDHTDATLGPVDAAGETVTAFGAGLRETVLGLGRILSPTGIANLGERVVNAGDDDPGPVVGDARGGSTERSVSSDDADRPLSIVGITRIGADAIESGGAGFLFLFAIINIFIGLFNLVPLLPLDGGHVAIAVYEKARSMIRGEPYQVDVARLLPITYAVVLMLVFLGVSTIYLDIRSPIDLGG